MINKLKNKTIKLYSEANDGETLTTKTETKSGEVQCIAMPVPRLWNMHWRFTFKLNNKVISAKNLELELSK
tara:strand:- start:2326 stop:2538 length:213 start_codon:yes stop_codon:yes gene_type:complete